MVTRDHTWIPLWKPRNHNPLLFYLMPFYLAAGRCKRSFTCFYLLTKTRLCHVHPTVKSLNQNMNHHWCFNIGNIIVIDVAFTLWNCGDGGDWSHQIHSAASPPTGVKVRTTTRTTHSSWCIHNLCSVCFTPFSKSFHYKQHHTSSKIDLTRLSPSSMKQGNRMSLEGKYDT